jgi:beta-lactamase regulating signal transducer with metallopeptidase domain
MGVFLVYILKSAVCLSVFYLFYRLLLSRETFHRFNRFAILGILSLSLLIPFCEVNTEQRTEVQQTMLSLEQLLLADEVENPVVRAQEERTAWVQLMWLVYLAGMLFCVVRNIYSLIRLRLLLRTGEWKKLENKVTLIIHDRDDLAPFSWIKYVVVSRKDLDESGREILIHELAHIRNRHSLDLFVSDVCIFFQWFNPAAWLLKRELRNIHEYEADEMVIREGVDAKQYQLLIIKKAVGARLYSMANSFNHSKLKKRITMMLKEKSNPWARLKYLYVLPLTAIAMSAFARPEISNELKDLSEVKVSEFTVNAVISKIENETMPQPADSSKVKVTKVTKVGDQVNTRVYVIVDSLNVQSGNTSEMRIDVRTDIVKGEPLVFVDGIETTLKLIEALNPDKIDKMDVLKGQTAVEHYGDKGKNGVILIELKKEDDREETKE